MKYIVACDPYKEDAQIKVLKLENGVVEYPVREFDFEKQLRGYMNIQNKDAVTFLNELEENSVDLLFADLPYNITNASWDKQIINLNDWWIAANRALKPNGAVVATACVPFNIILGASNIKDLKYEWIWEKSAATGHLNAKTMPMKAHENVLIFYKNQPHYNPQKTTGHKRKVSTAHHKRNTELGEIYSNYSNHTTYDSTERYPRTVLSFKSDKQKLNIHSTQKPLTLLKYFVETYTKEGATVVDSTCGSGGIGVACEDLGRNYILNDNSAYWCEVSRLRIIEEWDKFPPNKKELRARLEKLKELCTLIHKN